MSRRAVRTTILSCATSYHLSLQISVTTLSSYHIFVEPMLSYPIYISKLNYINLQSLIDTIIKYFNYLYLIFIFNIYIKLLNISPLLLVYNRILMLMKILFILNI